MNTLFEVKPWCVFIIPMFDTKIQRTVALWTLQPKHLKKIALL